MQKDTVDILGAHGSVIQTETPPENYDSSYTLVHMGMNNNLILGAV